MLPYLACLACLRVWRACVLGVLEGVRACYDEMFYFLMCLHTWCAFLSYLLSISTLKFKKIFLDYFLLDLF